MDELNVVVLSSIGENNLNMITNVSPKIKLRDASEIWDAPDMVTAKKKGDFTSEEFDAILAEAEVVYGYRLPRNIIARCPKLKWIQSMLAGVDHILTDDIIQSPVILTNTSGVHRIPVSEVALTLMLMLAKEAPKYFRFKQEKKWQRSIPGLLHSSTVGILGLGNIGKGIAQLTKAFGMRVLAIDETRGIRPARYVDKMLPTTQLHQLLAESDFVAMALPLTPTTNKLIGENELRAMKPTAYLVNVGRGATIDEEALIRALDEQWIAGAGMDAYTVEPLPTESRLWELPNVVLSPHVSGTLVNYDEVTTELFCKNLQRYLSGKKLINIVNKKKGY